MQGSGCIILLLATLIAWTVPCGAGNPAAKPVTIHACADDAEMPPFTFYARKGSQKTNNVGGASVDLLRDIGKPNGWIVDVQLLPWARCLALVAAGKIQIAINVDKTEANSNHLLLSQPYFTVHNVYFYSSKSWPQGIDIRKISDLRTYHLCGLQGYRFESFGLETAVVDRGTVTYENLFAKLRAGRCDLFLSSREQIAGMYMIDPALHAQLVDGNLVYHPLPEPSGRTLYLGLTTQMAESTTVLASINHALDVLENEKPFAHYLDAYLK